MSPALTYETTYETMLAAVDRRDRLDAAIAVTAAQSQLDGSPIGAYLGLVPTESPSGS